MKKRTRVLIDDDHAVVRQSLVSFLEGQPDMEIVGEASDAAQAVAMARRLLPDVVVMDIFAVFDASFNRLSNINLIH